MNTGKLQATTIIVFHLEDFLKSYLFTDL